MPVLEEKGFDFLKFLIFLCSIPYCFFMLNVTLGRKWKIRCFSVTKFFEIFF